MKSCRRGSFYGHKQRSALQKADAAETLATRKGTRADKPPRGTFEQTREMLAGFGRGQGFPAGQPLRIFLARSDDINACISLLHICVKPALTSLPLLRYLAVNLSILQSTPFDSMCLGLRVVLSEHGCDTICKYCTS